LPEKNGLEKENLMYRCLNPGAIGVSLDWEKCAPLTKAAGFEGIDVPVTAETDPARAKDVLSANGLKTGGTGLPVNFRGTDAEYRSGMEKLPAIARISSAIGQKRFATWILPFSDTLPIKENFRFHVERLRPAARILDEHGCSLGLEFLGPRTLREGHKYVFPRTIEHMLELCEAVGRNVGLLLDSWHWHTSLGTIEDILALSAHQVVYVHINDAPEGIPFDQYQDLERRLPGETGVEDLAGFINALRTIGYDGPVVPEPFAPELSKLPPAEAIGRVATALGRVWNAPRRTPPPATMKAVATGRRKAWLVDLPVPKPRGNEVVVKLHASPLCGSNMGAFFGDGEWINNGHEGAGEVVAVAHSNMLKVGDRVALAPLNACGKCAYCRAGDVIFCRNRPEVHGNFAQFTRVADVMCVKIPDDMDYDSASLMGCALGPAYEAVKRLGVGMSDTLVISGLGPVGLGAVALASSRGIRTIALDPEPFRRELACRIGAEAALDPSAPGFRENLAGCLGERGITRAIDCSGKPDSERMLIELAGIRAVIAFVGENQDTIPVSPSRDMIRKGLTLLGCWHMNMLDAGDLVEFLRRNREKAGLLISHRFGFSRVQEAFDTFASRKTAKVILHPWE